MNGPSPAPNNSPYKQMLRGAGWAILLRWGIRGIGLVSIVILARVLTPEDFGIVAMGSLIIGFLQGFSELGTSTLLIREPNVSREHCDTAWTIRLLQSAFIALLLILIASPAAHYFNEPRLVTVIHLLALSALLSGTENVGMVLVRKELDFAKDFRFGVYKRLMTFLVTVPLALILQNYWALVIGQVIGTVFEVLLSYRMHPYRPRFSLARAHDFLKFSLSIIPLSIGTFLNNKVDVIIVGGLGNTVQMGAYNVASELSSMMTREIVVPIGRGLYPNFAKLIYDLPQLATAFSHVLRTISIICLPLGFGLWVVAEDFVNVILGSQWSTAVPLIKWLAIYGLLMSLLNLMSGHILIVTGYEHISSLLVWIRLAVLVPLVIIFGKIWGIEGIAAATTISAIINFPIVIHYLNKSIPLTSGQFVQILWCPLVAVVIMVSSIQVFHIEDVDNSIVSLIWDVIVGAISYTVAIFGLWSISGRPKGVEYAILSFFSKKLVNNSMA